MPSPSVAPCLTTSEQVLIDGANGICGERHGRRPGTGAGVDAVLFLLVAAACAVSIGKGRFTRGLGAALVSGAALAASAGWWTTLAIRADAPAHAAAAAAQIAGLLDRLDAFAWARRECLETVHNDCVACQPLLRFVLPTQMSCAHAHGRVELRKNALSGRCKQTGDDLDCGSSTL